MEFSKYISAVDSHTMGEATRVVIGGIPSIPGKSMADKKIYLEREMDYLRKTLMLEPRGHRDMFGSILTQPVDTNAHLGIIFMDPGGYLNMCGHGSIGAVTVAIEMGLVPVEEPVTEVVLDTPAGLVKAKAKVSRNKAKDVTIQNVPSFVYKHDHKVLLPDIGDVTVDIAFGGSFFGIVSAENLGIQVDKNNISKLISYGMELRDVLNKSINLVHPQKSHINTIDLIEIYDSPTHPEADAKNCVILGNKQFDRSPCGTGTSAKMAVLYSEGKLKKNQEFIYESIIGTLFTGRVVEETKAGNFDAIIPEITGSAYITGIQQFVIDPDDPLKYGFSI